MRSLIRNFDTRFWLKVWPRGDCWEWRGSRDASGYGVIHDGFESLRAHRYAVTLATGTIPDELVIDHACNHKWCVKPSHLAVTTQRDNILRGDGATARNARKTHCKRGHLFDAANIYGYHGQRTCRTCLRKWWNARDAVQKRKR